MWLKLATTDPAFDLLDKSILYTLLEERRLMVFPDELGGRGKTSAFDVAWMTRAGLFVERVVGDQRFWTVRT